MLYQKWWLWLKFARDEKVCSAVRMAINDGNTFYDWLSGFDDASAISKDRPGLGLLADMIRDSIESKATIVELLRGSEKYKFDFTSKSSNNWRVSLYLHKKPSGFNSLINSMLQGASHVYSRISLEWQLLQVHSRSADLLKMFFSYGAFRLQRLMQKKLKLLAYLLQKRSEQRTKCTVRPMGF